MSLSSLVFMNPPAELAGFPVLYMYTMNEFFDFGFYTKNAVIYKALFLKIYEVAERP